MLAHTHTPPTPTAAPTPTAYTKLAGESLYRVSSWSVHTNSVYGMHAFTYSRVSSESVPLDDFVCVVDFFLQFAVCMHPECMAMRPCHSQRKDCACVVGERLPSRRTAAGRILPSCTDLFLSPICKPVFFAQFVFFYFFLPGTDVDNGPGTLVSESREEMSLWSSAARVACLRRWVF